MIASAIITANIVISFLNAFISVSGTLGGSRPPRDGLAQAKLALAHAIARHVFHFLSSRNSVQNAVRLLLSIF
jgi:hypothetical protein